MRTALDDLRGVARLAAAGPLARFLGVGVVSTLAFALLFLLLRGPLGAAGANAAALALTAVGNTAANRRLTFGVRGRDGPGAPPRRAARLVFVLTLGADQRRARRAARARPAPRAGVELAVLVVASTVATVTRYVALRTWVFARAQRTPRPAAGATPVPGAER